MDSSIHHSGGPPCCLRCQNQERHLDAHAIQQVRDSYYANTEGTHTWPAEGQATNVQQLFSHGQCTTGDA